MHGIRDSSVEEDAILSPLSEKSGMNALQLRKIMRLRVCRRVRGTLPYPEISKRPASLFSIPEAGDR